MDDFKDAYNDWESPHIEHAERCFRNDDVNRWLFDTWVEDLWQIAEAGLIDNGWSEKDVKEQYEWFRKECYQTVQIIKTPLGDSIGNVMLFTTTITQLFNVNDRKGGIWRRIFNTYAYSVTVPWEKRQIYNDGSLS
jgi:hypothetical protein